MFVAPFDVYFSENEDFKSPDHITQPDLSVVCSKDQISKNGCHGAPTIIIEVLSQLISKIWGAGILDCRPWECNGSCLCVAGWQLSGASFIFGAGNNPIYSF